MLLELHFHYFQKKKQHAQMKNTMYAERDACYNLHATMSISSLAELYQSLGKISPFSQYDWSSSSIFPSCSFCMYIQHFQSCSFCMYIQHFQRDDIREWKCFTMLIPSYYAEMNLEKQLLTGRLCIIKQDSNFSLLQ